MKRNYEEDRDQYYAKRPKQDIEVIEHSGDDNNNPASTQEPEPVDSVSDSHASCEICGGVLGREHPSTLISMNNLASVLDRQGNYEVSSLSRVNSKSTN
ncbi:hypothetical protein F4801DRAFT_562266 [Xylaria longipes]|nr:hypothetical protein F4801DRAFT_562266 [Xylaria longipes]